MILVIVESPSKCKKIESYLGAGYKCVASFGHKCGVLQDGLFKARDEGSLPRIQRLRGGANCCGRLSNQLDPCSLQIIQRVFRSSEESWLCNDHATTKVAASSPKCVSKSEKL